jgi:hypothetical protein
MAAALPPVGSMAAAVEAAGDKTKAVVCPEKKLVECPRAFHPCALNRYSGVSPDVAIRLE